MKNNRWQFKRRSSWLLLSLAFLVLTTFFPVASGLMRQQEESEMSAGATVAPNLSATKAGILDNSAGGDQNGNGVVNPGDRLTYTITINNSGADTATGVNFSDSIDANTTAVDGSLIISPIAVNDTYSSIGNVGITVPDGAGDLLSNDFNPNGGAVTITAAPTSSTQGGNLAINTATGAFSYNPPTGFEGTDTFTYTLSNGTGLTDTATVSITVSGMVWFVNNSAASCTAAGCGRLSNPFSSLAAFQAVNNGTGNNPAAGDNIFIYSGSYDGSLTLLNNQKLVGQGATATLAAITSITAPAFSNTLPATSGTNPTIITTAATANAVNLGTGNTIRGITIGNTTGAKLNAAANVGTLNVGATTGASDVVLSGNGQALNLTGGGTLAARFVSISSTNSSTSGITLMNVGGNLVSPTTTITNPGGVGISVSGSQAGASFDFGNAAANGSGATGVTLSNNAGAITFADLDIAPDGNVRALQATNSTGVLSTTSGTITASGAAAVEITNASGMFPLNVQLTSVSANGGANGIVLTNTSSSGSPGGFSIVGDGASDVNNTTRGRTTAKLGGGTIALGSGGTITGTSGKAVQLNNSANVVLRNMIVQNNGNSTPGSGGDGINAANVSGLTLDNLLITGHAGNFGLRGAAVSNLSIVHSEIHSNATTSGVEATDIWNVRFNDLTGSCLIQHSKFATAREFAFGIYQNGASTLNLSVSNSEFTDAVSGLSISAFNNSNVSFNVTGSSFLRDTSNGIFYGGNDNSGGGTLTVQNSNFDQNTVDINIAHQGAGKTQKFNVTNNTIKQTFKAGSSNSVNVYLGGTSTAATVFEGVISNNRIGNAGVANSGSDLGRGIFVEAAGAGTVTASVTGNTVRQIKQESAFYGQVAKGTATAATSPRLNLTVTGNDFQINTASGSALAGVELTAGTIPNINDNPTLCANIGGNTSFVGHPTFAGVYLVTSGFTGSGTSANPIVELQGYAGAANNLGQIESFLSSSARATTNTPAAILARTTGTVRAASAPCPTPQLPIAGLIYASPANYDRLALNDLPEIFDDSSVDDRIADAAPNFNAAGNQTDGENLRNSKYRISFDPIYQAASEIARAFSSSLMPIARAQKNDLSAPTVPESGETITKSIGTIPAGESVTIIFKVTVDANLPVNDFSVANTANITADGAVNVNSTTATTTVVHPPTIAKAFGATNIALNGTTSLTFTVGNANPSTVLTNVSFTDPLPAGLIVAAPNGLVNNCGAGTVTANSGSATISVSGLSRPANTTCTIQVNVTGMTDGAKNNTTSTIASAQGGIGLTSNTAVMNVIAAPSFTKAFGAATIPLNTSTTLSFTITNNSSTAALSGVSFNDNLPAGLVVADAPNLTSNCGGTVIVTAGATSISLSGATLAASANCTISVNVTGTTAGTKNNSTTISTTELGTGATASASLTVIAPPTIAKSFSPTSILVNETSVLTVSISNPSANTLPLTGVGVVDNLPVGTEIDATPSATNSCSTGTFAPTAGATGVTLSGATIPINTTCAFSVRVKATTSGEKVNTTNAVTSTNGGTGLTASATLTVNQPNYSMAGTVSYGTTPTGEAAKFVSDVLLTANGTPESTATTDSLGNYSLANLGVGPYMVTPSKPAQTDNTGISVQDASETAKIAFNLNTSPMLNQRTAADATGDGTVSAQDASEIAKRALNIASPNIVGNWKFAPAAREYSNLNSNLTGQNYDAILVGDVTGNWTPPASAPITEKAEEETSEVKNEFTYTTDHQQQPENPTFYSSKEEKSAALATVPVSLPNASGSGGTTVLIPVTVGDLTGQNVTAYDLTVSFDPTVLEPASPAFDASGTLTGTAGGYSVFVDPTQPAGRLRVGAFGTTPLLGQGTLIYLRFNILAGAATTSPLNFVQFIFGEGRPQDAQATITNGSFTRLGPTAAAVTIRGRVVTVKGRGIVRAKLALTNQFGETRVALTNSFGYYRFEGVAAGETYVLAVSAKNQTFSQPSTVLTVFNEISEMNFVSESKDSR